MDIIDTEADLRPHVHDRETLLDLLAKALMAQAATGRPVEIRVDYDANARLDPLSNDVLVALRERLAGDRDYVIVIHAGGIQLRHTPRE